MSPLGWIDRELVELEKRGLRRRLAVRGGPQTHRVVIEGRELINFGSNDYLGLAADERLARAARLAAEREGWGSGASPLVSGRSESHAELERQLAQFEGTEAALVFPSGFAANTGIVAALVQDGDAVFSDAKNHASLIDGCRLSRAERFVYPHRDCRSLERLLDRSAGFRRRLIVSDTLFSMDGDFAPLAQLADLAVRYDAMFMLDEAHATGVVGPHGRGVSELLETEPSERTRTTYLGDSERPAPRPLPPASSHFIRVGTLSKALGSGGGFVCGSQSLIDWLANRARTYVFSTAQPPAVSAAALAAIEIVRQEPERRQHLLARAAELRSKLNQQGWNTGNSQSQIIPVFLGEPARVLATASALREAGYYVPAIRPPTVPAGESLLRVSLCYHHTAEEVEAFIDQMARLR
ncbi:MAG: 8-amino-7-oxononanoate synthase [Pirellulales bacterium]|nr:8-amino-7-oxononanoate synthase [Pirellulales bacterium]